MNIQFFLGLIHNIAIMLLFAWIYDILWVRLRLNTSIFAKILAGLIIGGICIVLMNVPAVVYDGVFFDMRSVFLSTIGLFIGGIPTLLGILIATVYRISIGGDGIYMGVASILSSGLIGLLCRYFSKGPVSQLSWYHFLQLGIVVHFVMSLWVVFLPEGTRMDTFKSLSVPILTIYPLANFLLAYLFVSLNRSYTIRLKLKEEQTRLAGIIEATNVGTYEWNIVTNEITLNDRWAEMIGYTLVELSPSTIQIWNDLVHPEDLKNSYSLIQQHFKGELPYYQCEVRMKHKEGHWVWVLDRGKVQSWTNDGKPLIMLGTHTDISAKKKADELHFANEKMLTDFFSLSTAGFFFMMLDEPIEWNNTVDKEKLMDYLFDNQKITRVNQAMLDQYGAQESDFFGRTVKEFFAHDIVYGRKIWCDLFNNGKLQVETHEKKIDGSDVYIFGDYKCLYNEKGHITGHFGVQIDITQRKISEHQINKLSEAVEQSPASVVITALDGSIEYVNERFTQVTGYTFNEVKGKNPKILNGRVLSSSIYEELWKTISNGKLWKGELINRKKNGELYWESASISPIFSDEGKITHYVAVKEDISKKKNIEEELIKAKEIAENASKAKSEFLANMSHEIRTPLNGVIGFTELLRGTSLSSVQHEYVSHAITSANSLLGIINDILDFSKIEAGMLELEVVKTDIIELLNQSVDIIKYEAAKKNIELLLDIDVNLPRYASVDALRLKQILANLLGNAVKFTAKGEIELKVIYQSIKNGYGKLSFMVRDTGIGILQSQKDKLFKAFSQADSSTTRKFGGTGLGLIISEKLANKMGSGITLESEEGKGSRFLFDIETEVEQAEKEISHFHSLKKCLIIDDNVVNCTILHKIMESFGFDCMTCNDAFSALALLEAEKRTIDFIICDYNMPNIDGIETIQMIREKLQMPADRYPILLLYTSVDAADLQVSCSELGVTACITKPATSKSLWNFIQSLTKDTSNRPMIVMNDIEREKNIVISEDKKSILIVEDNEFNMMLIKVLVKEILPNATIFEAMHGQQAVELYRQHTVDLILMDIHMPIMDGIEATQEIRKMEKKRGKHTPIVALTANTINEERDNCLHVGMDDFISKPIVLDKLSDVLKQFFS